MKASDNSGSVDLTNFMNLWQQFKASVNEEGDDSEEEIKKCFKDYDKDGDGYITKDEMMNVRYIIILNFFFWRKFCNVENLLLFLIEIIVGDHVAALLLYKSQTHVMSTL